MKRREVNFLSQARADLLAIFDYVVSVADETTALNYAERVESFIINFDLAAERGQLRDDIRAGLRVVGFERKLVIAFAVDESSVAILRIFSGGQNWQEILQDG